MYFSEESIWKTTKLTNLLNIASLYIRSRGREGEGSFFFLSFSTEKTNTVEPYSEEQSIKTILFIFFYFLKISVHHTETALLFLAPVRQETEVPGQKEVINSLLCWIDPVWGGTFAGFANMLSAARPAKSLELLCEAKPEKKKIQCHRQTWSNWCWLREE